MVGSEQSCPTLLSDEVEVKLDDEMMRSCELSALFLSLLPLDILDAIVDGSPRQFISDGDLEARAVMQGQQDPWKSVESGSDGNVEEKTQAHAKVESPPAMLESGVGTQNTAAVLVSSPDGRVGVGRLPSPAPAVVKTENSDTVRPLQELSVRRPVLPVVPASPATVKAAVDDFRSSAAEVAVKTAAERARARGLQLSGKRPWERRREKEREGLPFVEGLAPSCNVYSRD